MQLQFLSTEESSKAERNKKFSCNNTCANQGIFFVQEKEMTGRRLYELSI